MAVLLFVSATSSVVRGATISQSLAFRLSDGGNQNLSFAPFDGSLGVLENVSIAFDVSQRHTWALWNGGTDPAALSYTAALAAGSLTLDGYAISFASLSYGPADTPVLAPVTALTFGAELGVGFAEFQTGTLVSFPSAFNSGATLVDSGDFARPLSFTGELPIAYSAGAWTIGATNAFAVSLTDVSGNVTATYHYRAFAVPESLPVAPLMPAMFGLLFAFRKWKRPSEVI